MNRVGERNIIRIANQEKEFKKNNVIVSPSIKKDYNELVTNSYVVRPARNVRTRETNAPAHPALIPKIRNVGRVLRPEGAYSH
ncbi:hypothetical protein [Paenibacillus massiliensis]|uniref:hypothetical protein n=1 Tax=Paenibacillus massiliensis TaxID=225917 RepID=UPI0012DDEC50|nr:hypothetical protein [Paenibacillus massiliensis]